jgi:hypothetical protein
MPGRKPLRRIQFGLEVTPGTPVAATARMRWNGGMLDDQQELVFPPELVGVFGGTDRSFIQSITAALDVADTPITPEQLPYLLAMLYGGPTTGAADGSGSTGFQYVTAIPVSSVPANTSYTVEGGDDYEVERMDYAKATKVTLKGTQKGNCTMSASLIGQQVARLGGGFSATTLADTNDLIFAGSRLYLDPIGAIGSTLVTNQFLGFEITFEAMWIPKFTGEGAPDAPVWSFAIFVDKKVTGKITLEHDAAVDGNTGIKSQFRANTPRAMRIDVLGQTYATPGSGTLFTGGRRGLRIDLPVRWTKVPPLDDLEGNDIITVEFESRLNSTFGDAGEIIVCNEVSTLP